MHPSSPYLGEGIPASQGCVQTLLKKTVLGFRFVEDKGEDRNDDLDLGTAVEALLEAGEERAASLLLDVLKVEYQYIDTAFEIGGERSIDMVEAQLTVPRFLVSRFDDEVRGKIVTGLDEVLQAQNMTVREISIYGAPAEPGWRDRANKRLGVGPSNQAQVGPPPKQWITIDRLRFRSVAEEKAYLALRRAQDRLPRRQTISIIPNAGMRVLDHTWEPDFIITYKGRVGAIEMDGPTHSARAAADKSRDRIYEDCGASYVDRWVVEDATDDGDLDLLVDRFLHRLGSA